MGSTVYSGISKEEVKQLREKYQGIIDKIQEKVEELKTENERLMNDKNNLIKKVEDCEDIQKENELHNINNEYKNEKLKEELKKS